MNTPLTHSPVYAEPADYSAYCPQAVSPAPSMVDKFYDILLTVRDALNDYTESTLYCNPDVLQSIDEVENSILYTMHTFNRILYHG